MRCLSSFLWARSMVPALRRPRLEGEFVALNEGRGNKNDKKEPRALSPTPLHDWVERQPPWRRAGFVGLFALLIACGGKAGISLSLTPVPATHQLFFALLAGALLGGRLGAISSLSYLL